MNHEKGEGEIGRNDTCDKHMFPELEPCVYVTRMRCANVTVHALCAEKCAYDK